ncbi:MAG TPA: patatin-like phospholipase family protein [Acidimicrobiales bacterium]|nr:patatin-like phospholipase family protein [Acidimicrobiales bacterium]
MGAGKTAFVLAGGGTKGAFEAGAVRYLVEEETITPEVITATSAGSICAAVLAQARTHQELVVRAGELHDDLLAMTHTDLLFGKQPWLGALDGTPLGRAVERFVLDRTRPAVPGEVPAAVAARAGRRRRLQVAARLGRSLPHLLRAGRRLRKDAGSLMTLEPLARALREGGPSGIRPVDPALIARPGLELRMAVAALGDGALRYVTQDGHIVASDAVTPVAGPVDVLDGVLASATVPLLFPPRPLAGDVYVDGGVANNVPVDAAVRLGATRVFAILAVPLAQPRDHRDYTRAPAPLVFLRAAGGVAFVERQLANLNPPLPDGTTVTVIDPVVDVVGPFEVSQGLMLLDMDYGWMRAADVLAEVGDDVRRQAFSATDAVVVARTRAWHREEAMWAAGRATAADRRALAGLKGQVRDAVNDRKGLGLPTPPDPERWWSGYEVHAGPAPADLPPDPLAG